MSNMLKEKATMAERPIKLPIDMFDGQIDSIKSQFFAALDDFKKYYVYYNKNPEVNEFQNFYSNSKGQLQSMSRNLFLTTNDIDKEIDLLEESIETLGEILKEEKLLNANLLKQLKSIQNTKVGSVILIDDSKSIYNEQYYYNWELIVGILLVCGSLATVFKSKMVPTTK